MDTEKSELFSLSATQLRLDGWMDPFTKKKEKDIRSDQPEMWQDLGVAFCKDFFYT